MELRTIYIWTCFVFCLGLTAGGMLVLFRYKNAKKLPSFQYLQYYLVLIYTFGFYSLWSKIFFQLFFSSTLTLAENTIVTNFLLVLGVPFLLIGKIMLVLWNISLLKKKPGTLWQVAAFIMSFLLVLIYLTYTRFTILSGIRQVYAVFVISITLLISSTLLFSESDYLPKKQKLVFILLITFSGFIYLLLFLLKMNQVIIELVFAFLFFLTNTTLAVYFIYSVKLKVETEEVLVPISFDAFIEKYTITSREAEIVQYIYQGKTNQEIADKLFVTVQTIKDHTHRIYQKTEVKSRAQLTLLMRKFL